MKLVLHFIKWHWILCAVTILLLILDVMGGLFIPTLAAEMLNLSTSGASFDLLVNTGIQMAVFSVISGAYDLRGCSYFIVPFGHKDRSAVISRDCRRFGIGMADYT